MGWVVVDLREQRKREQGREVATHERKDGEKKIELGFV